MLAALTWAELQGAAKSGWGESGVFFLQASIGLLLFSSAVDKVRKKVVEPAWRVIREKLATVNGMQSAYQEASVDAKKIYHGFRKKATKAVQDFQLGVKEDVQKAQGSCFRWLIFAVVLHLFGCAHWMGGFTLLVLWPICVLYAKVWWKKRKAMKLIGEAEKTLTECDNSLRMADDMLEKLDASFEAKQGNGRKKKPGRNTTRP